MIKVLGLVLLAVIGVISAPTNGQDASLMVERQDTYVIYLFIYFWFYSVRPSQTLE
jgi:hypothetical protein